MSLKISCDQATTICDKSQYNEASVWEKIQLNFHLIFCKICKRYTKHNGVLTKICKNYTNEETSNCLSDDEKEQLQTELLNKMK